jgi:hypothetical protein
MEFLAVVVSEYVPVIFRPSQFTFRIGEINQMRRILKTALLFSFAFCFTIGIQAQEFKPIAGGVEYAEFFRDTSAGPIRGNLIRIDPKKARLEVVHAMDAAIGVERTSSIASRHGAFAAVNAGFFRLDSSIWAGDAAGIMKIDGRLISESYGGRVALGLYEQDGEMRTVIDRVNTELRLVGSKGGVFPVDGINRERKGGEVIVYTKEFGVSTLTDKNGIEILVDETSGKVLEIRKRGSNPIASNTFVLSLTTDRFDELESFLGKQENIVRISSSINTVNPTKFAEFNQAQDIVGGVGYILQNGIAVIDWEIERTSKSFYETRHPRTAFAVLKDGSLLLITIDGRQADHSIGVGLQELAEILKELGAVEVINLDGGGSTAMYLQGKIVNKPSDREGERRVSDALLVFPKAIEK